MKKLLFYLLSGIAFAAFNTVMILLPRHLPGILTVYTFTMLAFLIQATVFIVSDLKHGRIDSLKLVAVANVIMHLIAFILFAVIPILPLWLGVLVCLCVFGVNAVFGLTAFEESR